MTRIAELKSNVEIANKKYYALFQRAIDGEVGMDSPELETAEQELMTAYALYAIEREEGRDEF